MDYFDAHGGLEILGYPITDAFLDYWTGLLIQYTQNSRLELYPEPSSSTLEVRLKELGVQFVGERALERSTAFSAGSAGQCEYYELTGHSVCFAFLEFYRAKGGPQLFGYPVSEFTIENDRLVQYFQGFRLDWYPENPIGDQVQVAPLGRMHFDRMGYDRDLLSPKPPSNSLVYKVLELQPSSSVAKPVTSVSDAQELFVSVRDQNLMPVQGAAVTALVHFPTETRTLVLPPTDANGVSRTTLVFEGQPPGSEVDLEYFISTGTLLATARDAFRIWW